MLGRPPTELVGEEVGFAVVAGEVAEVELVRPGPDVEYCEMRTVDIDWEGSPCRLALLRDVTERRAAQAELAERATHDALTHLPNRYLLLDRLAQALARIHRGAGPLALFFVDLDGFKAINDRYGHATGDAVLVAAAHLLHELVRPGDTAARFGGDEFLLVCESMDEPAAEAIVERVEAAFASPLLVDGQPIAVGASVGYALLDDPALTCDQALALADAAMYQRKRRQGVPAPATREAPAQPSFRLKLYVAGGGPGSAGAEADLRRVCEGRFHADELAVECIDVLADVGECERARILATPTVVRDQPLPVVRVVGDLTDADQIAAALGLPEPLAGRAAS